MRSDQLISSAMGNSFVKFLFLGWVLTLPFGAKIMSLSIGFMTLYPNLIFSVLLLPFAVISLSKWSKLSKFVAVFLLIWILYAVVQLRSTGVSTAAIFDLRSLIMQFVFSLVIFTAYFQLGKEAFYKIFVTGLRSFLVILIAFGAFEYYTGIHFSGTITAQFPSMAIGNNFYAPLFIYDNPNDFLAYALFVFLLLTIFDKKFRESSILTFTLLIILFVFAQYADSKFARMAIVILCLIKLSQLALLQHTKLNFRYSFPYVVSGLLLVILVFSNPLFIGPKYQNSKNYRLNSIELLERRDHSFELKKASAQLSKREQLDLIEYLDSLNTKSPEVGVNLRKNLILNGIDFIRESPITGIGPGEYNHRLATGNYKYFIHKHLSPHNLPIEIVSQFGLMGWSYLLLVFVLFVCVLRSLKSHFSSNPWMLALFLLTPILWMMPSGYLYLDIHWIFLPIVVLFLHANSTQNQSYVNEQ